MTSLIEKFGTLGQLESMSLTTTSTGARKPTFTNLGQPTKIWLQPATAETIKQYQARKMKITHTGYLLYVSGVKHGDRVTIKKDKYIIKGKLDQAGLNRLLRLDVEEYV